MRNLMGRLHARDDAELARIAAFWGVTGGRGRQGLIGALFRVLSDARAARDAWERLHPTERVMARQLALAAGDEAAPTLPELAARLGVGEEDARQTAARLYRIGIVSREGDGEALPVGQLPRLFLPREIAAVFRRVQDEIEAGDLRGTPLRALIELLDDAEIEAAAAVWGIPVVPGLRGREELVRLLLRQMGDPERLAKVLAGLGRDAGRLWQVVTAAEEGAALPLARAVAEAGLDGDDPRATERRRAALDALETALLVWHSYRPEGERSIFVPGELRAPSPPPSPALPALEPVIASLVEAPPWRHPDALAWDLLTLLRELAPATGQVSAASAPAGEAGRGRLRRLNSRLWHRGEDLPPLGYVDFLLALARAEGVIEEEEPGSESGRPRLVLAPGARSWRDRAFPEQTERLRWWWLASTDWIEGRERGEVEVWGVDWRGARRRLLALLADAELGLEAGAWYTVDSVTARIAARDPELLGSTFTAATARVAGEAGAGGDEAEARAAAIADVVRVECETALAWFGLVELADVPGKTRAVRVVVRAPAEREAPGREGAPALAVTAGGGIALRQPSPLRVWALSAFAELEALDRVSRYRLSPASLARALAAGFDLEQVTTFLTRQSGQPLPTAVADTLQEWARGYRRVRLRRAVVVAPDDPETVPAIERLLTERGFPVSRLAGTGLLVEGRGDGADLEASVSTRLREAGYAPQPAAGSTPRPAPPGRGKPPT